MPTVPRQTVWDGKQMIEGLTVEEAKQMVEDDKGQWLQKHNGSAFKFRKQFTGYSEDVTPEEPEETVEKEPKTDACDTPVAAPKAKTVRKKTTKN